MSLTIREMTDYECMHTRCCDVDDPNNVRCNINAFGEPANLVCLDKSNLVKKNYGACFSENEVVANTLLNPSWPQEVCSEFGVADNCNVYYPVDPCPADVCKMEKCNDPDDSFVCYQVDPMGNAIGPGDNWQCRENKPQNEIDCSSRYGKKLCDLSKCGDYPGQDDCYGRGRCVRFNEEGCTGCSCEDGYVGYFCDECAGGYSCIENGDIVDSEQCLPPNKCQYTGGRCNNRGTPLGGNGPCTCPPGGKRYFGFDCQMCNSGICYNPKTFELKDDPNKYNGMNCPYPYVCDKLIN